MRVASSLALAVVSCLAGACPPPADGVVIDPPGLPDCEPRTLGPAPSTDERGVLIVLAGEGGAGYVDGDNPRFNGIGGIGAGTDDHGAFVVFSDIFNGTLRRLGDDGSMTTVIGAPLQFGFAPGVCDEVRLNGPRGLAVDPRDGSVWFGDGPCLMHADLDTGETTKIAGDCESPGDADGALDDARFGFLFHDLEIDGATGRVYIADRANDAVRVVDVDAGTVTTLATGFDGPGGTALDVDSRTLYVADTFHHAIMGVDIDSGAVVTLTGTGTAGSADGPADSATVDAPQALALIGDRLVFGGFDGRVRALNLIDASVTTLSEDTAGFFASFGVAPASPSAGGGERLLLADVDGGLLELVGDDLTLLFGNDRPVGFIDGPGADARFDQPSVLIENAAGDAVLVADSGNNAIRVVQLDDGAVTTLLGSPDKDGDVDGPFASAELSFPSGLALDAAGTTLYVAATGAGAIKKLDLVAETVETIAVVDDPWELALDEQNNKLYVISSAAGALVEIDLTANTQRVVSDGFTFPIGLAVVAGAGGSRVFVADNAEHILVEVDVADGQLTTVVGTAGFEGSTPGAPDVAQLSAPSGLDAAVEGGDDVLYVAETNSQVIRRVSLVDFSSTFVVGDPLLSGSLPPGARVSLTGAPILNPFDVVAVGGAIVIAGDTTILLARP